MTDNDHDADIVTRLRHISPRNINHLRMDAADEIERLRGELRLTEMKQERQAEVEALTPDVSDRIRNRYKKFGDEDALTAADEIARLRSTIHDFARWADRLRDEASMAASTSLRSPPGKSPAMGDVVVQLRQIADDFGDIVAADAIDEIEDLRDEVDLLRTALQLAVDKLSTHRKHEQRPPDMLLRDLIEEASERGSSSAETAYTAQEAEIDQLRSENEAHDTAKRDQQYGNTHD